jgi:hypothetical protein
MNNQFRRELKVAKVWYYNFRYSIYFPVVVPSSAIGICLLIIVVFILPQMQNWFSLQAEIRATQTRIQTIKDNISYLQVTDAQSIDSDFNTAIAALPANKEFIGILGAISTAASANNVSLQDYSFAPAIASVQSGGAANDGAKQDISANGMTPIQVSLVIQGDVESINGFIQEIEKRLPLSEVKEADFNQGKAQIVVSFYTRAMPKLKLSNSSNINTLTAKDRALLQKLKLQNEGQ